MPVRGDQATVASRRSWVFEEVYRPPPPATVVTQEEYEVKQERDHGKKLKYFPKF